MPTLPGGRVTGSETDRAGEMVSAHSADREEESGAGDDATVEDGAVARRRTGGMTAGEPDDPTIVGGATDPRRLSRQAVLPL